MPRLLVLILVLFSSTRLQATALIYATLGPEAPSILRVLIGGDHVAPLQPGELDALIKQRQIDGLILPIDWAGGTDLETARASGISVTLIRRHTSVANIIANIRDLAALTRTEAAGDQWISQIEQGLAHVRQSVQSYEPVRVLVLTPEAYTEGQNTLITELIGIARGINVAAEAGIPEARQIDDSQIREFAPDVVLLIGWQAESASSFALNPLYRGVPAFDVYRIYQIAPLGKDPARLVDDVQVLVDLLHPSVIYRPSKNLLAAIPLS